MTHEVLVPISALEHWSYCPRQCGLIHLESVWDENVFTVRGAALHERVDRPQSRAERRARTERALPVWSERLGLVGKCDVVEFHLDGRAFPVEYKSGGPRHAKHAAVQLCAQALCLEEMTGRPVQEGALYFAKTKAREIVAIDDGLRAETERAVESVRAMLASGRLPAPANDKRCPRCSLIDACLPGPVARLMESAPDPYRPAPETELP